MKFKFVLNLLFLSTSLWAAPSAQREAGESYLEARERTRVRVQSQFEAQGRLGSAFDSARPMDRLDVSKVPDLQTEQRLTEAFNYFRDTKFISERPEPLSQRRLSWLYPDDGCYTRAALATHFAKENGFPEPYKLFVFGNLAVRSRNHPAGVVHWWYHVVPVYKVGNQAYAIDPSIEPRRALTIQEWKKAVEFEDRVDKFSICKPMTFDPDDSCQSPRGVGLPYLLSSQIGFLDSEWHRLQELGRDPESELGERPPWR
jgi:hypothetical protein